MKEKKELLFSSLYVDRQYGGLSRFTNTLIDNLKSTYDIKFFRLSNFYKLRLPKWVYHFLRSLWEVFIPSIILLNRKNIIFISTNIFPVLFFSKRSIIVIHDLSFIEYPNFYKFSERLMYWIIINFIKISESKIVTISNSTKKFIINKLKIKEDRIFVIYNTSSILQVNNKKKYKLPKTIEKLESPFILLVNNGHPRKNLNNTVNGFLDSIYYKKEYKLVIVGLSENYFKYENKNIITLNKVSEENLLACYQNCAFNVLFSYSEGFGLPIIEAMHFKKITLTSGVSSLSEITGDYKKATSILEIKQKFDFFYENLEFNGYLYKNIYNFYNKIKNNNYGNQWNLLIEQI